MPKQRPINLRRPISNEETKRVLIPISGYCADGGVILRYMFSLSGKVTNTTIKCEELSEPLATLSIDRIYSGGHTVLNLIVKRGINQFDNTFPVESGDCIEVKIFYQDKVEKPKFGNIWFSCLFSFEV